MASDYLSNLTEELDLASENYLRISTKLVSIITKFFFSSSPDPDLGKVITK